MGSYVKFLFCFFLSYLITQNVVHALEVDGEEVKILNIHGLKKLSLEDLMEVIIIRKVSIATGKKQAIMQAPAVVSLITADDIRKTAALDVDDVLETVPGLHVARSPVSYYNPIYTLGAIHSFYNPETLVLVDGIPTNTLYTGGRILIGYGGISTAMVEQIEIIRGPASAIIYGADAFSGVINIITKKGENIDGTKAGIRLGSFRQRELWLQHGKNYNGFNLGLTVDYHDTLGQKEIVIEDGQTQYDKLSNTHASLAPMGVDLSQRNWDINLNLEKDHWKFHTLYQKRNNIGVGTGVAQSMGPGDKVASDRIYTDLTYHDDKFSKNWELTTRISYANVSYITDNCLIFPVGTFGTFPNGMRGQTGVSENHTYFDISGVYHGIDNHELRLGIGHRYGDLYNVIDKRNFGIDPRTGETIAPTIELTDLSGTSAAFLPTGIRNNWQIFAQDVWTINEQWELTAGARYDYSSDFGSVTNPRFGLVWKTTPSLTSKFLYGRAFRAPSFQELYQANNPVALGNPDLSAERIETWEVAADYREGSKWYAATNLFSYRLTNKILFVEDDGGNNYIARNADSQRGYGLVLEGGWLFNGTSFTGSYAYQHAQGAANFPKQDIYLRFDWKLSSDWLINTQAHWILDRERAVDDPREPVKDYFDLNLAFHYNKPKSPWWATLALRNVLNADIREPAPGPDEKGIIRIPYDIPMARFNYFLELGYQF